MFEPVERRLYGTQTFSRSAFALVQKAPAPRVLHAMGKDAKAIKFMVNIEQDLQPVFTESTQELENLQRPHWLMMDESDYRALQGTPLGAARPALEVFLKHRVAWVHDDCVRTRPAPDAGSTAATVARMNFIIRRARPSDASDLPAIERSAAELFRCDPSLAWLADAQVIDAEQHQRAIETNEVWVAQSPDGVLMGFLSAVEVDNELHIQELSVRQRFQGRGAGRKLLLTAVEHARDRDRAAQMSLPYALAARLVQGHCRLEAYNDEQRSDPRIAH